MIYYCVTNLIYQINLDLQQVALSISFAFTSYIHLYVVRLLWNHFEEKNFNKKMNPLKKFKNKNRYKETILW